MLGVALLYNHFLLEPHEILVNINVVAVPVDTGSGTKAPGPINANAWRFIKNGIAPYEFTHADQETTLDNQPMQLFLAEFGVILAKWNLANIIGLCSLKETQIERPTTMEFTSGRANITFPFDVTPSDGNVVDAIWQFQSIESVGESK